MNGTFYFFVSLSILWLVRAHLEGIEPSQNVAEYISSIDNTEENILPSSFISLHSESEKQGFPNLRFQSKYANLPAVTLIIRSFERPKALRTLLQSIRTYGKSAFTVRGQLQRFIVMVAEDSKSPNYNIEVMKPRSDIQLMLSLGRFCRHKCTVL